MKNLSKFDVQMEIAILKNGANVFLFKRKGMPIYLRAAFYAGSRFDEIPGTAHFMEHMLLAGTKKFPSKNLIADYIQKVGGDFGASTDPNMLRFNVEIPIKEDIKIGIEVLNECLTRSLFDVKTIEMERGAILSELKSKRSNPKEYIWDVSRRLSMQKTPLENTNLGTEENINSITLDTLKEFNNQFIHSGRAVFVASGDIEIGDLVENLNTINLPPGEKFKVQPPLPIVRERNEYIERYPGLSQLQVFLVTRTSIESYKEFCALRVLINTLSVGRGSRLITKLRYEHGLVYFVNGSMFDAIDWGVARIQLSCDRENLEKAKNIIYSEFDALKKNNITSDELKNAQSKISKGSIRQMQTSESWVDFHENKAIFLPNNIETIEDYIRIIETLRLEDIQEVINKYLIKDNFYIAICGEV